MLYSQVKYVLYKGRKNLSRLYLIEHYNHVCALQQAKKSAMIIKFDFVSYYYQKEYFERDIRNISSLARSVLMIHIQLEYNSSFNVIT
jgi:hypothetical protein